MMMNLGVEAKNPVGQCLCFLGYFQSYRKGQPDINCCKFGYNPVSGNCM